MSESISPIKRRQKRASVLISAFAVTVAVWIVRSETNSGPAAAQASLPKKPCFEPKVAGFVSEYARPTSIPFPADNAYTESRVELGQTLFFDPRLSASGIMSCATCHNPSFSWGDGMGLAVGHAQKTLGRRTPTILNLAWVEPLMWDGRKATLEDQALGPIEAAGEMNMDLGVMESRVNAIAGYREMFAKAYPGEPIDRKTIAKAIANFERTIVSNRAPFDRWIEGNPDAISESAKRGFIVFNTTASCNQCHSGWAFTDGSFHDIGVKSDDVGRFGELKLPSMKHAFKTPGLRNIDQRAPYMHNGSEATLEDVVELYNKGGRVHRDSVSPLIQPLNLSEQDKRDLVEFLKTLTSNDDPIAVPTLPR